MISFLRRPVCSRHPVCLLVLDGWGIAPESQGNAIFLAKTPFMDYVRKRYPMAELIAAGESVGLPANEVGNTEVGHLTMGAGRAIFQDLVRINRAIEDKSILKNKALLDAVDHVKQHQSALHYMGLVGTGNVHSSMDHLYALITFAAAQRVEKLYLHLFTDGRDSAPMACLEVVRAVQQRLGQAGIGKIASLGGRYYAMDRDRRWERIQLAYEALVGGKGETADDPVVCMQANYDKDITDEFIKPTVMMQDGSPVATISDNDAVVFFNFRIDRPKQLSAAFVLKEFEQFRSFSSGFDIDGTMIPPNKPEFESTFTRSVVPQNVFFVTMTNYQDHMPVSAIAFGPEAIENSFPEVLTRHGLTHMHMAESEKERFVTYYFNGLVEGKRVGEDWDMFPSPKIATYDLMPEMSVHTLSKAFVRNVERCEYDFFVMNFANPDMVAHTGNVKATIKAIEHVDKAVRRVCRTILKYDGWLFITADHGNAEDLLTFPSNSYFYTSEEGSVNTSHSYNKVPLHIISNQTKDMQIQMPEGTLADVAPTMLSVMGLPIPEEMDGCSLLTAECRIRKSE